MRDAMAQRISTRRRGRAEWLLKTGNPLARAGFCSCCLADALGMTPWDLYGARLRGLPFLDLLGLRRRSVPLFGNREERGLLPLSQLRDAAPCCDFGCLARASPQTFDLYY
ncbi:hypothetical protein M885DRAFT_625898, partial [Pelagophyceae sp. CCMP2097]